MRRHWVVCRSCGYRRMRLLGKSWKTARRPQAPTEDYFQCPNCGKNWSHNREQNIWRLSIPPKFARMPRMKAKTLKIYFFQLDLRSEKSELSQLSIAKSNCDFVSERGHPV
jgi:DNA-directed RNA polymerase subunit RPC12/RpoP